LFHSCTIRVDEPTIGNISVIDNGEYEYKPPKPKSVTKKSKREEVIKVYNSYVGVREKTGKNDGKEVEEFLRSVNLGPGYAWCAAYVHFCLDKAGVENNITAWSPTAENKKNFKYRNGKIIKQPERADVFTLYYPRLKRIGHTGFFDGFLNESMIITNEGNTNMKGSNEGDGVYKMFRPLSTIHSITDHINEN
jgi:hypothetical protein